MAGLVGDLGAWHLGMRCLDRVPRVSGMTVMLGYWVLHSIAFWSALQGGVKKCMRMTPFIKQ